MPTQIRTKPVELKESRKGDDLLSEIKTPQRVLIKSQNEMKACKDQAEKDRANEFADIKAAT